MIVETMNIDEVRKEINADLKELKGWTLRTVPHYKKYIDLKIKRIASANKRRAFKSPKLYTLKTQNGNNWVVICDRDESDFLFTYFCYFNSKDKVTAYMLPTQIDWQNERVGMLVRYTSHFFSRYRERLNLSTKNLTDTMKYFFTYSGNVNAYPSGEEIADGVYPVQSVLPEGMGLGFSDRNKGLLVMNTFISKNEMRDDQSDLWKTMLDEYRESLSDGDLSSTELDVLKRIIKRLEGDL